MKKYEMLFYSFVNLITLIISDERIWVSINSLSHPQILTFLFNGRSVAPAATASASVITHPEQATPILLPNLTSFFFISNAAYWSNSCLESNVGIDEEEPLFASWNFLTMPKVTRIYLLQIPELSLITCKRMIKQYHHLNCLHAETFSDNTNQGKGLIYNVSRSSCMTLEERCAALEKTNYWQ